ncbi:hypothetical protein GQ457_11G029320 [Hibiscus cannabinus]
MGGFPSGTEVPKVSTHEQCKAISTRSGKFFNTPAKNIQGEEIDVNPNTKTVLDNPAHAEEPASAGLDHEIQKEPEEADPIVAATPQIRLPKSDTLEDNRPPPPFPQRLKNRKKNTNSRSF